jgi:ubiquinone/menaquinone biosynthesis C-methylase UbiE
MDIQQAYNSWASQYDSNENKTRDLEAQALQDSLSSVSFIDCLEMGCGTGKNTEWLLQKAKHVTAVDLSEDMLAKAREKIASTRVEFIQADMTGDWNFTSRTYDLVSFSLVLEHIENLDHVFREAAKILISSGHVYVGELHPFKQYTGSKARFETTEGLQVVPCFNHHVSDFISAAKKHGLNLVSLDEYFDEGDRRNIARILVLIFQKK